MKKIIYLCDSKLANQLELDFNKTKINKHYFLKNKNILIWPATNSNSTISPQEFLELISYFNFKKIILIDTIFNTDLIIKAVDHINRTGLNYLIGNTPYKSLPTFPDVSNTYREKNGKVFISVGNRNKTKIKNNNKNILSKWVAPIAVVWSYLGINIEAYGVNSQIKSLNFLNEEN